METPLLRTEPCASQSKWRAYWVLIKDLQTGLLLLTGLAGYVSGRPAGMGWGGILVLLGSLFLAIGGSTALNMVIDRDIDGRMLRTACRPLPTGVVSPPEGLALGVGMSLLGVALASHQSLLFGGLVLLGLIIDVFVYTLWLKRRTAWSIVLGGIAGGMPVLAGRALAVGRVDDVGIWLALAVLFWIPTHMLTFGIKYGDQYAAAAVPVFSNVYGERVARLVVALSTGLATLLMLWACYRIDLAPALLWGARGLGAALLLFTLFTVWQPNTRHYHVLFKLASLYMLGSMILIIAGA